MDLQSLPWYAQFLVFLLIGGIVFGIFYMLHYSDGQTMIENLDRQIETLEEDIRKAEKKERQLKQIKEEKEAKEKVLEKLKEILPEEKEIAQILRRVQGIITNARLKIQKWATQKDQRKEVYTEVPIAISLDGSYHNLGQFFDQLSRLRKIFTVNGLTISPIAKMTSLYTIRASFTASTYTYQKAAAAKRKAPPRRRRRR
ncbi:MAG: type 4a pilus biogenesis protein PilO [Candidatus Aminicenantes bacterium]|jgi:type IV pilus assembly protein PilO